MFVVMNYYINFIISEYEWLYIVLLSLLYVINYCQRHWCI